MTRASLWTLALGVVCCARVALADKPAMNKQDWKPPIFVVGPRVEPYAELQKWLRQQEAQSKAAVKLPFTLWFGPSPLEKLAHVSVGLLAEPRAGADIVLNDSALGVSLRDRLHSLCPKAETGRCAVWLSGRFTMPTQFAIYAVHEAIALDADAAALRAELERSKSCLVIRSMHEIHCARGTKRCEKCRAAAAKPAVARLLDVCPEGDYARPTITLDRDGKRETRVFDVVRTFADDAEAKAFASKHGLADVQLASEAE